MGKPSKLKLLIEQKEAELTLAMSRVEMLRELIDELKQADGKGNNGKATG